MDTLSIIIMMFLLLFLISLIFNKLKLKKIPGLSGYYQFMLLEVYV